MLDANEESVLSTPFNRRTFLKGVGLAGGGIVVAGWGVSPWIEDVFIRRGTYVYPDRPPTMNGVKTTFSVCKQCRSDCGIVARTYNGVLEKLDGNPFHPNSTEPHAPYSTNPLSASVWSQAHSLCARGQAGRQTVYDPYRITAPLKRTGPRGSGQYATISWTQLIEEVTQGGKLFSNVSGEESRYVEGYSSIWNSGQGRFTNIDPKNSDFGPQTNGLVIYWGRAESGQNDFLTRFAHAFGTVNVFPHVGICELNHHVATQESLNGIGGVAMLKPDILNSEFIIWFGANVTEANFPMQTLGRKVVQAKTSGRLEVVIVDPRAGNANLIANQWVPIKPGGDGALALGMIRNIIESNLYNSSYLQSPNLASAQAQRFPNYSNASWLVVEDPSHANYKKFLRVSDLSPLNSAGGSASDPVVIDLASGNPMSAALSSVGNLWPNGLMSTDPIMINGVSCKTSFMELYSSASEKTLDEYAKIAGIASSVITDLSVRFTGHGTKAVADFYRGPAMHTNGVNNCRAIMILNFLVGNLDVVGGSMVGGGAADFDGKNPNAIYPLASWPNQPSGVPKGVPISREGVFYEKSNAYLEATSSGKSPFPAPRPWFPFGFGIWPEIFAGIYQQYPYPIKILFQHEANPAWSPPAIGGAPDGTPWIKMITDLEKVPLFISTDIVLAESSSYADYIVPDTSFLEGYGVPTGFPTYPTKTQGIRIPVVKPLTSMTPEGEPMSMEQFLIDVAKKIGLPGFGQNAFADGGPLNRREEFYFRQIANIAYDPTFLVLGPSGYVKAGPVPDAGLSEFQIANIDSYKSKVSLPDEVWNKIAYVLARGGRFEDYLVGYLPSDQVANIYTEIIQGAINESSLAPWSQPANGINSDSLESQFLASIAQIRSFPQKPTFATHTYGSMGKSTVDLPCQIYNEVVATTHNALTGELFSGVPLYLPASTIKGKLLSDLDPVSEYPFMLSTHKQPIHSKSRTISDPWLLELMPESFIDINPIDANKLGVKSGSKVRVISATRPSGMRGTVRVLPGIRPGVITFPAAFGHWQYGSGSWTINGQSFEGDQLRNAPVHLNALMRLDPDNAASDGWTIGLEDPVGGGAVYFDTSVKVIKD